MLAFLKFLQLKSLVFILILNVTLATNIKHGIRLHNHYGHRAGLSQHDCFSCCQNDNKCRASTYESSSRNCFLYENYQQSQQHGWVSFFKNQPVQQVQGGRTEVGTRLHNHYDHRAGFSQHDCFSFCQRENRCRASTYESKSRNCFFYENYQQSKQHGWVSYFKNQHVQPVQVINHGGSRTEVGTRLHNHYDHRAGFSQHDCFSFCQRENRCRASTYESSSRNCYFYENYQQSKQHGWVSFFKGAQINVPQTSRTTATTTRTTTISPRIDPVIQPDLNLPADIASRVENGIIVTGHYDSRNGISQLECYISCQNSVKCKAASYNPKIRTCYYSEKQAKKTLIGWNSFFKAQPVVELSPEIASKVEYSMRLIGHFESKPDQSIAECFIACLNSSKCKASSYDLKSRQCYFSENFEKKPTEGWNSFIKPQQEKPLPSEIASKVENGIRLIGHYEVKENESQFECFILCQSSVKCKASTYNTQTRTCYFSEEFEKKPLNGWNSFVKFKPRIDQPLPKEIESRVEIGTRLIGHYELKTEVSQYDCFTACQKSSNCKASTYNTLTQSCYLSNNFEKKSFNGWNSFVKPEVEEEPLPSNIASRVENGTRLIGHYEVKENESQFECFILCQSSVKCKASTYNRQTRTCYFSNNFEKKPLNGWNSFIKQDPKEEQLPKEISSRVEEEMRLIGHYEKKTRISQAECFIACQKSSKCLASTFNTKTRTCYFSNEFEKRPFNGWNSFVKEQQDDQLEDLSPESGKIHKNTKLTGKCFKTVSLAFAKCVEACEKDDNCHAVTYDGKMKKCLFFNEDFDTEEGKGFTSFIKDEYDSFGIHLKF